MLCTRPWSHSHLCPAARILNPFWVRRDISPLSARRPLSNAELGMRRSHAAMMGAQGRDRCHSAVQRIPNLFKRPRMQPRPLHRITPKMHAVHVVGRIDLAAPL